MKKTTIILSASLIAVLSLTGCEQFLGSKGDDITDEIFEDGKKEPGVTVDQVAYAALLPFWEQFDKPTDVFVGYDELVYVTDAKGLHVLDRAGRRYTTIDMGDIGKYGATSVTQDRLLNTYITARYDTVITEVDSTTVWNLSAVYKIKNANGAGAVQVTDTLVQPFLDNSRSSNTSKQFRLDRNRADNEELVELTSVAVLGDNDIYVSRKGPRNSTGQAIAPDNTVLLFTEDVVTGKMRNTTQLRSLHPTNPSFMSGISINDITTLVGPPQRESVTADLHFIIAQGAPQRDIPFRTLWINGEETIDGLIYRPNASIRQTDTTRANSFLYDKDKFKNPTGIAYSADSRGHIFVVDAGSDSLYMFQSNGYEGVNPPPGSAETKAINVSFGGTGSGPRQFDNPSGVAYFKNIVYVADTDNNRIARYKLTTDFE